MAGRQEGIGKVLREIDVLVSERKEIEKDFERRKKLLVRRRPSIIDSSNWEDWKVMSAEYDELKQIVSAIDKKLALLRKIQGHMA